MNQAQRSGTTWLSRVWPLVPVVAALLFTSGLLLLFVGFLIFQVYQATTTTGAYYLTVAELIALEQL